ncbi:MAG: T9SS type A sorting domain-containing protein, partial [Bacteroidota bacterium]
DEKGTVNYFENTDTSTDNSVPNFVSTSVDVGLSSAPSFVDIDGDGDFDAFVGELNGNINYFENTGTIASPTFTLQSTNNAFGLSDVGLYSSPSFVDIDGDGDLDVFVGEYDGNINYFENTGTITAPAFTLQSTNGAFGLSDVGLYASPSFADIDGDGDLDAFVGERDGNINYFENTGTITAPAFTLQSTNGAFGLSDVGLSSSPSFVDLDRDGDLDAFIGERDGNINYFENTSTDASIPAFTLQSTDNAFGLTDVGINSTPSLVDIDGDGDFDVFIGKYDGNINYFKNVLCNEEGQEFQVNTYTTNRQNRPSVASNSEGDFVVVWESRGQDGSYYGIYGQRYTSSGSTVGSEFQINTYTPNRQLSPKVAMDEVGNFVVVWESREQDGDRQGIFGQLYNSDGTLNGSEFQINTFTTNRQQLPEVAMDADGDFVVVWESLFQDGASMGVFGQLYNSDGTTNGGEFQVNTETISYQDSPSVAMDADGDFAVVWSSQDQDGSERSIFGQLYNSDGTSNGAEFQINTETNDDQRAPSVAMDDTGNFVVVWTSVDQDGSEEGVFGQRYFNDGTANGGEFQVNTETNNDQGAPSVSLDADGDFVVVWESEGQDGSSIGIFGQRFQNNGFPLGSEFLVNAEINNNQNIPAVAMDGNGDFVVVWQSQYQDGDDNGIFGQRYIGVCTQDCKSDPLTLSNSENANQNYYTQAEITSTQSIESGAVVLYQAATSIELQAGFHAQSGSVFTAKIEDCAASSSASNEAVTEQRTEEVEVVEEILTTDNDKLQVFPNPTNGLLQFTIPSEAKVQSIALYDQLGKLVRQVPIHERQLSLADLGVGMYVLVVRTEEGTYVEKVLRKQ